MKLYLAMRRNNDYEGSDAEIGVFSELDLAQNACNEIHAKGGSLEWDETKNDDGSYHGWGAKGEYPYEYEIVLVDVNKRLMLIHSEWKAQQAEQRARYQAKVDSDQAVRVGVEIVNGRWRVTPYRPFDKRVPKIKPDGDRVGSNKSYSD